jgi:hypothetical protein
MIGDLVEWIHFDKSDRAEWIMQGFLAGYGILTDDMAFRTAIHVGVHLLNWYNRRDPKSPVKGTPAQILDAVATGRDFIIKGWERDTQWFASSPLASLFVAK